MSQVDGVAEVTVNGAEQPAMRIRVNPVAIASMGIAMEDVRAAISNANAATPLGTFDGSDLAHTIGTNDQLRTVPDYKNLVIKAANGVLERGDGASRHSAIRASAPAAATGLRRGR